MSEDHRIVLDGLTFRVRIDRAGATAPWLVFSNSLLTDLTVWDGQVDAFADRFNILRYDQRGHGRTDVPARSPDFAVLAQDVAGIMEAVGVARCTFVGLSMGVPTGLQLFARHPDRVERLVLCDGGAATTPERGRLWAERMAGARRDGLGPLAEETLARWFSADFVAAGKADRLREVMRGMAVEGFAAGASALQAYDCSAVLARIDVPTLLIVGERDGDVPKTTRRLADVIRGAVLEEIPDAGHIPNVERPEAFNAALGRFLAQ